MIVPTTPLLLGLASLPLGLLRLALLRLALPLLALLRLCVLRFADCPRAPLLLLRLRVAAADFVRAEPPEERDDPLRDERAFEPVDPLALLFDAEPFDEPLLLCLLREAALLLLAIRHPSPIEDIPPVQITR
ncbi:MAG: hypothetical protein ABWZ63_01355 [Thermoleophilaceae bacterium]